jgi:hypothetical protein
MTPQGPITFCCHHARKFATALRAYPSTAVGSEMRARHLRYEDKAAWRGVMWRPSDERHR